MSSIVSTNLYENSGVVITEYLDGTTEITIQHATLGIICYKFSTQCINILQLPEPSSNVWTAIPTNDVQPDDAIRNGGPRIPTDDVGQERKTE